MVKLSPTLILSFLPVRFLLQYPSQDYTSIDNEKKLNAINDIFYFAERGNTKKVLELLLETKLITLEQISSNISLSIEEHDL